MTIKVDLKANLCIKTATSSRLDVMTDLIVLQTFKCIVHRKGKKCRTTKIIPMTFPTFVEAVYKSIAKELPT